MGKMSPEGKERWLAAMRVYNSDPAYIARQAEKKRLTQASKSTEEKAAFSARISAIKKGKGNGLTGRKWSEESRRKASESAKKRGATHNFFKDGNGHERDTERRVTMKGVEYRLWREKVFKRDDFTCQECGARGGKLHADHVKRWKEHPELRFDVGNGQTLCVECHLSSPTYGNRT